LISLEYRYDPSADDDVLKTPIMMKITVVGATGPTGIHVVTELRKTVAGVRVIARSTERLALLFPIIPVTPVTAFPHAHR
jgi:nucleoside-diphosphate-sugar epimerase